MDTGFFDVETSRFPDGNPYRASAECISWAVGTSEGTSFGYHTDADFKSSLSDALGRVLLLVCINGKYDIGWARRLGIELPSGVRVWDCQLAEYILSGQEQSFASMDQLCAKYDIPGKSGGLEEYWGRGMETVDIPRAVVEEYNRADIERTRLIYEAQLKDARCTPALKKLILLGGADLLVLQRMEENGIRYDKETSLIRGEEAKKELDAITTDLDYCLGDSIGGWNWDSGDCLSVFLYGGIYEEEIWNSGPAVYQSGAKKGQEYIRRQFVRKESRAFPGYFKPLARSEVAKSRPDRPFYSVAEPILRQLKGGGKIGKRVVELLLRRAELSKLADTYYCKIPTLMDEMEWGDYVHGQYNQVVARTGRLSSSKPNMQNNPEAVDRLFVSRFA